MKIALIGATGFVGSAILNESLNRRHLVTAIVRNPDKVTPRPNLTIVKGDALDANQVSESVKGHDAVISAYNPGWTNPDIYNEFLKGASAIQEGVKRAGVKRLITVGGAGSLFITPETQLIDTPDFPADWKPGALAAREYLNIIKQENELEWTFLSPAIEMHPGTSGERKGTYRTGLDAPVFDDNNRSVISVEDTAVAIVDEAERGRFIRQRFTIAY